MDHRRHIRSIGMALADLDVSATLASLADNQVGLRILLPAKLLGACEANFGSRLERL